MEEYNKEDIRAVNFDEAIRLRPDLYFQRCFEEQSLNIFPFEYLCHALDEYFDNQCSRITIQIRDDWFSLTYNAGMSLQESWGTTVAERIMTRIGVCSNEKKHLEVGAAYCQIGIATLNAASSSCKLETSSLGQTGKFEFANGKTISSSVESSLHQEGYTRFEVLPNYELFGDLKLDLPGILAKAQELAAKLPGLKIEVISNGF